MPADAPRLPDTLLEQLLLAGTPAVASDSTGLQPLCCLLATDSLPTLEQAVAENERSPRKWLQSLQPQTVNFDDTAAIWSVNTPEELSALQTHAGLAA